VPPPATELIPPASMPAKNKPINPIRSFIVASCLYPVR
jgi:hypothetical protein